MPVPRMATSVSKFREHSQSPGLASAGLGEQCLWGKDGLKIYTFPFASKQCCFRFAFLGAVLKVILGPQVHPIHADADMAGHTCQLQWFCSEAYSPRHTQTPHTFCSLFVDLKGHDDFDRFWCIHQVSRWMWMGLKADVPFQMDTQRLLLLKNCTGYQPFPCGRAKVALAFCG